MKLALPIVGLALVGVIAVGTGCAENDDFVTGGRKGDNQTTPKDDPTPTPSGSGIPGGVK